METATWSILEKRVSSASQTELHLCNATCVYVCYMYPFTNLSSSIMASRDYVRVCIIFAAMGHRNVRSS